MMTSIDRQESFSGTKPVPAALAFDAAILRAWLAQKLGGDPGALTVAQFKGGQSNPTYRIETAHGNFVLRRKPPGPLLASAHAIDREFRVLEALAREGFPVARPIGYEADAALIGSEFYVMDCVEGRVIWEPWIPNSNPTERAAIFDAMNATLAQLHAFDPAAIGLGDFGRAEGYVARQIKRWSANYKASETQPIPDMDWLMGWLPDHVPPAPRAALVHGDYRLDNLILAPDAPRVAAVLDWELATLGDPLADAVYHFMTWVMPPSKSNAGTGTLIGHDLDALGIPAFETYAHAYAQRAGLSDIPHFDEYMAYNLFRMAAILQGIAGRVRDGTATSEHGALMGTMVAPLAATAMQFARRVT
jgi:aminoglycoside phosphotransferase (APT) family kinase protein